jgi:uncharacterized protein YebE (UPF0316 family)
VVSANALVTPLTMAGLAIASVGLWTLRVALAARGRKAAAALVAAVEAVVFATAFTRLASELDAPERVGAYAVGVAIGTLLGLSLDERLSGGQSELRVVVPGARSSLPRTLHQAGWPATWHTGEGPEGPVTLLFVAVDDSRLPDLIEDVRRIAPGSFWTVHRFGRAHPSVLPTGYIQVHSRPHLAAGGRTRDANLRAETEYLRLTRHLHLGRNTRRRSPHGTATTSERWSGDLPRWPRTLDPR